MASQEIIQISISDILEMVFESDRRIVSINEGAKKWTRDTCYNEAKKYKARTEFQKGCYGAYQVALKNGWLDDYKWLKPTNSKPWGYWNKETCENESRKYKTRAEFKSGSYQSYALALKNGWIDDYNWLSPSATGKKWDKETCYSAATECFSKREFEQKYTQAYRVARSNGWIDDYTWFEKRRISDKPIYTVYYYKDKDTNSVYVGLTNNLQRRHKEHCNGFLVHGELKYDIVYKYFHSLGKEPPEPFILKKDLYANDAQQYEKAYVEAFKNEGVNVLNLTKAGSLGGLGTWTQEKCYKEAQKYQSRVAFAKNSNGAYNVARKNGWLDDYTWFTTPERSVKWTHEACYQEARKYKSCIEFINGNGRAYKVAKENGWIDEYTWLKKPIRWTREKSYNEAKKYKSKKEFEKGNGSAYQTSWKNGWLNDYTWFENPNTKWSCESCYNEAKKYNSRTEFAKHNGSAYNAARKNGWINDYTWFSNVVKWDRDTCYNEAKKYNSRKEFQVKSRSAYTSAWKHRWLDDYTWFKPSQAKNTFKEKG